MRPYGKSQLNVRSQSVSFADARTVGRCRMKIPSLLLLATVALAPLSAVADSVLVKFDGGIGAIPVSGTDPTTGAVTRNVVRGVQPPNQIWAIADLAAEVKVDGHIRVDGRGLVFAGGNTIGTAVGTAGSGGVAVINVFATFICENAAPFNPHNTNPVGVPLAENGDFKIDDVLSNLPLPSSCGVTPVLLIRNAGNQNWFAAGIQKFD